MGPFNVLEPGKRPRATLTPTLALRDGKPYLAFSVQGGDTQDQNLLQFFLAVVEFGMTPQEAAEAANITSYQMRSSFGKHESLPGRIDVNTLDAAARATPVGRDGLPRDRERPHLGADHRDLVRSRARHDVGRCVGPRRGLRDRVVAWPSEVTVSSHRRMLLRAGPLLDRVTAQAARSCHCSRCRKAFSGAGSAYAEVEAGLVLVGERRGKPDAATSRRRGGGSLLPDLRHDAVRHARRPGARRDAR